jgi:hypothetical protein
MSEDDDSVNMYYDDEQRIRWHQQEYEVQKEIICEFISHTVTLQLLTANFEKGTTSVIQLMANTLKGSRVQILGLNIESEGIFYNLQHWFNYYIGMLDELKMVNHGVLLRSYHGSIERSSLVAAADRRNAHDDENASVSGDDDEDDMTGDFNDLSVGERHKERCLYHKRKQFVAPLAVKQYNQGPFIAVVKPLTIKACRHYLSSLIVNSKFPPGKIEIISAAIDIVTECDDIIGKQFVLMAEAMHEYDHIANQVVCVGCCFLEMSNEPYNEHIRYLSNGLMHVCEAYLYRNNTLEQTFSNELGHLKLMPYSTAYRLGTEAQELQHFLPCVFDEL